MPVLIKNNLFFNYLLVYVPINQFSSLSLGSSAAIVYSRKPTLMTCVYSLVWTGFEKLEVLCPKRTVSKIHLLHPQESNKTGARYYIVTSLESSEWGRSITVRSPLQVLIYIPPSCQFISPRTESVGSIILSSSPPHWT